MRCSPFHASIRRTAIPVTEGFATDVSPVGPSFIGQVEVVLSLEVTTQRQQATIRTSLLLLLGCLSIVGAIGASLAHQITTPILRLEATVHRLQGGDLAARLPVRSAGELGNLEAGINAMAAALQASHQEMEHRIDLATQELRVALTERAMRNRELEEAHRQAEQAARVKAEFLANMSHEIRTPLNGVIGFIRLLAKTKLTAAQAPYVNALHTAADNLLATINSILDFSKLEAGKVILAQQPFDLHATLTAAAYLFIPMAEAKGLSLSLEIAPAVPVTVIGDAQRLIQIVTNLVANAIKFTYRGEVSVEVQRLYATTSQVGLLLTVRDTGIGMAPEDLQTIFDAFNQIDASTTRQQGGTGLGLAICQQLVSLMGGQITVESQAGVGTAFYVKLDLQTPEYPVAAKMETGDSEVLIPDRSATALAQEIASDGERSESTMAPPASATSSSPHQQVLTRASVQAPRVLVVDDQELNQMLAQLVLEDLQVNVDIASTGWEALAACQRTRYDLILMDIRMPGMDGLATTRAIRQLAGNPNQHVPIIALTADVLHENRDMLLEAGMVDCLYKPIQPEELIARFQHWCEVHSS